MAVEQIKGDRAIRALQPGAGRLNDGGGLYLVPYAWGDTHAWRLDYTHGGKRRTLSLGTYPKVGLEEARQKAREAWSCLAQGGDPMARRQTLKRERKVRQEDARRAQAGEPPLGSVEEIARRWFEIKKAQWMESYSSKIIRRLELHAFPRFGHLPIGDITPKTVLEACRAVERNETLETAHRLREHCGRVFRFAIAEGMDLRDPCQDIRDALRQPVVKHHAAIVKPEPLAALLRAIDGYTGTYVVKCALRLAPLRKHKLDGTPYFRRDEVEAEIQALAGVTQAELERRAGLLQHRHLVTRRLGARCLNWTSQIKDAQAVISKRLFEAKLMEAVMAELRSAVTQERMLSVHEKTRA